MKAAGIQGRSIDMAKFAQWLVGRVAHDGVLWGAHYYTGDASAILGFLDTLETTTGYFVHRKPRKSQYSTCHQCGARFEYTTEKEVDTQMVADMIRLAAVGAFDEMALMSGDADHSPGLEAVMQLGKRAWVGLWGAYGASSRIVSRCFGRIDLLEGLDVFQTGRPDRSPEAGPSDDGEDRQPGDEVAPGPADTRVALSSMLDEIRRAHDHFSSQGGYLGVSYFISRWKSAALPHEPLERERLLDIALDQKLVEVETRPDGKKALRPLV
jgi:uncharacterized LabA/DUF88 family protein